MGHVKHGSAQSFFRILHRGDHHQVTRYSSLISLEQEIKGLLTSIVREEVSGALTPERLSEIIYELAVSYAKNSEVKGLEVMANPGQLDTLCSTFQERLGARLKVHPIELKPVPDIDAGIKVSFNEDAVLHDFSSEAITEMLSAYLNPRILEIIKKEQEPGFL